MTDVVRVLFVDAATGAEVGRSELPVTQLPASFDAGTTVDISGTTFQVERTEPATTAQAAATGTMTLWLSRIMMMSPNDILFSLPTLCDAVPTSDSNTNVHGRIDLHEDDWRQLELVDASHISIVERQLDAIRTVVDEQGVRESDGLLVGFRSLHVRTEPANPLTLPRRAIVDAYPAIAAAPAIALRGEPGVVADSFALGESHLVLYGVGANELTTLGLHFRRSEQSGPPLVPTLAAIMAAHGLVLVDWCRCAIVTADQLPDYLNALAG